MSDSVGRVGLEVTLQGDIEQQFRNLAGTLQKTIQGSLKGLQKTLDGIAGKNVKGPKLDTGFQKMGDYARSTLQGITGGFSSVAAKATEAGDKTSQSISRMQKSLASLESSLEKNQAKVTSLQGELNQLYAQQDAIISKYRDLPAFSGLSEEDSLAVLLEMDSAFKKLNDETTKLEGRLEPLRAKSSATKEEIRKLNEAMAQMKSTSSEASNQIRRTGTEVEKAGRKATKSGKQFGGFAKMINRSFMSILRRLFVYNLMLKAIRGIMNYMNEGLKTNKEYANSLAIIKTNLKVAFQPIFDFIVPAINALVRGLATATTYIASFISGLFGKTYKDSFNAAKGLDAAKKSMDAYGVSAKKAARGLASFDEINNIAESADAGAGGGIELGTFEMPINIDEIEAKTSRITTFIRESFTGLIDWIKGPGRTMLAPIGEAFDSLWNDTLIPMKDFMLYEFWGPVSQSVLETVVPIFAEYLPFAFEETIKNFQFMADTINVIWESVIKPTYELIRDVITDILDTISDLWEEHGETLLKNVSDFMDSLRETFRRLWTDILEPIITPFLDFLKKIWDDYLKDIVYMVGDFILKLINGAIEIYNGFIAPIVNWLIGVLGPIVSSVFEFILDVVDGAISGISDILDGLFGILGGIIDFIVGVFTGDWERAWKGLGDIVTGIWDTIIGAIKGVINLIISAINGLIKGLNKINFNVPDWVPLIGGKNFGFNIPLIPKLAKGGIIDQPTLAMVGERGKEAVMPLENNTGWIRELAGELADMMGYSATSEDAGDLVIEVDGDELGRISLRTINRRRRKAGLAPV